MRFMESAEGVRKCRLNLLAREGFLFLSLLCAGSLPSAVADQTSEDALFFYSAKARWEEEAKNFAEQGKSAKGRHNQKLLKEFLQRWPESEFADEAFLMLMQEATCQDWHNYPDCGTIEVRVYEEFLKRYPGSEFKEEVRLKMAEAYYQMAYLWLYGEGVPSEKWSELFRAESLRIIQLLQKSENLAIRRGAKELEEKLSKDFKRPIAPIPPEVLDPSYL